MDNTQSAIEQLVEVQAETIKILAERIAILHDLLELKLNKKQ